MGIYDRNYYRDEEPSWGGASSMSMVAILIVINIAAYVVDALTGEELLHNYFALESDLFRHPWKLYQLVSYGFLHDLTGNPGVMHLLFNMIGLYFFGRDTEGVYGRNLFLKVYLSLTICSGLVWLVAHNAFAGADQPARLIGASGAVYGVMVIFAMHFPHRIFLIWGVLPVKAWVLATLYIAMDLFGTLGSGPGGQVAHSAHLGGAAFGFLFYRTKWSLASLFDLASSKSSLLKRKPKLKVHAPQQEDPNLADEVDRILEKISREGEGSLTARERSCLEEASRRYQRRGS